MSGRRIATYGGLAALGGASYYLYTAGGDPKLAEKKFEHDAAAAARKVKGSYPGQDKEAKKAGEEGYEAVRARAADLANEARREADKVDQKVNAYSQDAKKKFEEVRQETGKEVTDGINKSKGWFGGFFGGK